jgi:hypothetical protein
MIFSLDPQGPKRGVQLSLDGDPLEQVASYRYLGVQFDQRLTFAEHTRTVVVKTKRGIGAVSGWIRKWASTKVLEVAMSRIVLPSLLYAIEVWSPTNQSCRKSIEGIQKYAARLILNDFKQTSQYEDMLKKTGWKPLYRIVAEKQMIYIKRFMDGLKSLPTEVFQLAEESNRRESSRIAQRSHKNSMKLKIFKNQKNNREENLAGAKMREMWNELDETTVRSKALEFRRVIQTDGVFQYLCDKNIINGMSGV